MVGTNFNFRSQCCGLCWLIQISKEMYEFSPSGQLHYEIFVNSFLRKLLDRWCTKQVRHSFTVVFFSRTFYLHELDPTKVCIINLIVVVAAVNMPPMNCESVGLLVSVSFFRIFYRPSSVEIAGLFVFQMIEKPLR